MNKSNRPTIQNRVHIFSQKILIYCLGFGFFSALFLIPASDPSASEWPQYPENPFVIKLDLPPADDGRGGLIAFDVTGDGLMDYLVTKPGHLVVYDHHGRKLWGLKVNIRLTNKAENDGLPGLHGPGVQAADIDGDGQFEIVFLTEDGLLQVREGKTGGLKRSLKPSLIPGVERWEQVIVANLRGKGDRDLIFQACPSSGPESNRWNKRARLMAAFPAEAPDGKPLWQTDRYWAPAHGSARIADLDGDGLDEVAGVTLIDHDGLFINQWRYADRWDLERDGSFHLDSLFIQDVRPDLPGFEVVLLEEGANHVSLVNTRQFVWRSHHQREEPQNAAVGDFDPGRPGLEIWCRSRHDRDQKPFVFDSSGRLIAHYEMSKTAPADWSSKGVEVIWTIDWTGDPKQLAAAKERHTSGDVAIFDPLTGRFIERFKEKADRLYVADVSGDWREEILVISGNELRIYHNPAPNPNPDRTRLWSQNPYRRSKMTWNYYSP